MSIAEPVDASAEAVFSATEPVDDLTDGASSTVAEPPGQMGFQRANPLPLGQSDAPKVPPGHLPKQGGGTVRINYELKDFKAAYLDEYTREELPHAVVRAAIREELEYFNQRVWELADTAKILGDADAKPIRARWVICNKGGL